jgi:hypothetical protein
MNLPPNARFVLTNDGAGADVTDAFLSSCAASIDHVLTHSFKDAWGGQYTCVSSAAAVPALPQDVKVSLQADSSVQGAAGYHDDGGIYCFRDGLPALSSGAFAFSVVISHEVFEAAGDPGACRWSDNGQGEEVALEFCDAVESFSFVPPGQSDDVSDFLLPSFFDPGGVAPFSHLGKPTAPMTTASANGTDYQIVRSVDENGAQQVTAAVPGHTFSRHPRANAKFHPSSRTRRRGVGA